MDVRQTDRQIYTYFKTWTYVNVRIGKSEICRKDQKAGNSGADALKFEAKFLLQGNLSSALKTTQPIG